MISLEELYNNCYLAFERYINKKSKIQDFYLCVFELAKELLQIYDIDIEFKPLNSERTYGYLLDNKICLNSQEKNIFQMADTIFHELRHVYQRKTEKKKVLNCCRVPGFPIERVTSCISYLDEYKTHINPFYVYFTSTREKDARDYAYSQGIILFDYLKEKFKNNKKIDKYFEKNIIKYQNKHKKQQIEYDNYIYDLKQKEKYLSKLMTEYIEFLIDQNNAVLNLINIENGIVDIHTANKLKTFYIRLHVALSVYCDDNLTKKLLDYVIKIGDIKAYQVILNCPFTKISKKDWFKLFEICKDQDQTGEIYDLIESSDLWDKSYLYTIHKMYCKEKQPTIEALIKEFSCNTQKEK